ncbi:MAG: hypothetical protein EKK62_07715 [Acidimicrobiia bacterium]|nr:MAG: hypothetical protein EKK62_07715 [Acidimicrobiia bacterium]
MTLGQYLGALAIVAASFGLALDAYQRRWYRSREVKGLYALAVVLAVAGLVDFLVSVGWWRIAAALALFGCVALIAVGMAIISAEERAS